LAGLKKSAAKDIPYIGSFQINTHTTTLGFRQQLSLFVLSAQSWGTPVLRRIDS
jgi:hypothetical protein